MFEQMQCVCTHSGQACFMCSLGLHICNIAAEVLKFLSSGVKSHDPFGTMVLGNPVRRHPKTEWQLLQIANRKLGFYDESIKYIFKSALP